MLEVDQDDSYSPDLKRDEADFLMGVCVAFLKRPESNSQKEIDIGKEVGAGKGVFVVVRRGAFPPGDSQAVLMFLSSEDERRLKVDYLVIGAKAPLTSENVTSIRQGDLENKLFGGGFFLQRDLNGFFPIGYRERNGVPFWNKLRQSKESGFKGGFGAVERDLEIKGINPLIEEEIFSNDHTDESILAILPVKFSEIFEENDENRVFNFPRVPQKVAA